MVKYMDWDAGPYSRFGMNMSTYDEKKGAKKKKKKPKVYPWDMRNKMAADGSGRNPFYTSLNSEEPENKADLKKSRKKRGNARARSRRSGRRKGKNKFVRNTLAWLKNSYCRLSQGNPESFCFSELDEGLVEEEPTYRGGRRVRPSKGRYFSYDQY